MKKCLLLLVCLMGTLSLTQAQATNTGPQDFPARFKSYYNAAKFDSIYTMFSAPARPNFSSDKTRKFLSQMQSRFGQMKTFTFLEYQSGFTVYKAVFDKWILSLHLSFDVNNAVTALYCRPYEAPAAAVASRRNLTPMHLPCKGEWSVFWGGDTKELNYHVIVTFQEKAFDLIRTGADGKSYRTDGRTNEDYYAFGQELLAPCEAEVVAAIEGIPDNLPGEVNPLYAPGNSILLKTKNAEYILLAHMKQNSIRVRQGQRVRTGDLLGQCGNSGNSGEPHLHFQLHDKEPLHPATGIKCYFSKLEVNGISQTDYSPIKGDKIKESK